MKKLRYFCSALLVACLLTIPVAAQQSEKSERSNSGSSKSHGKKRAEQVQAVNKKGDKDPNPTKGSKNKGQHEGSTEKKGKAKAKGHSK
jgi:hypothetical protein